MATQPQITEPEKDEATGKLVYTYQPRDSEGQFIGKPYRFLYTDHQDLVRQLTEAKEYGDRYIHEVKSGKRQLKGEPAGNAPTYQPAPESTEETERKRREEFRRTAEQELGAPLDAVRADIQRARQLDEYLIANTWAQQHEAEGYYICKQNAVAISKWLKEQDPPLKVSSANLDLAFEALRDTLVPQPQEQEVTADSTQQQQPTKAEVKPRSSSIMPGQLASTRQPSTERLLMSRERFRQINKMSRDEWKKLQRTNPREAEAYLTMKSPTQPQ